jgi:hypothetical protein
MTRLSCPNISEPASKVSLVLIGAGIKFKRILLGVSAAVLVLMVSSCGPAAENQEDMKSDIESRINRSIRSRSISQNVLLDINQCVVRIEYIRKSACGSSSLDQFPTRSIEIDLREFQLQGESAQSQIYDDTSIMQFEPNANVAKSLSEISSKIDLIVLEESSVDFLHQMRRISNYYQEQSLVESIRSRSIVTLCSGEEFVSDLQRSDWSILVESDEVKSIVQITSNYIRAFCKWQ